MTAEQQRLAQSCAAAAWTPAANGTHIMGRGYEIGRFTDKAARDLAVSAVNGLPEFAGRVETLELDNETLRAALERVQTMLVTAVNDRDAALSALESMVGQHCADGLALDSMALSSNADALEVLAKHGRVRVVEAAGRRILAEWVKEGAT